MTSQDYTATPPPANTGNDVATHHRYRMGRSVSAPWNIDFTINDAETMTDEDLIADMPRIQAALLRYLGDVRDEARR